MGGKNSAVFVIQRFCFLAYKALYARASNLFVPASRSNRLFASIPAYTLALNCSSKSRLLICRLLTSLGCSSAAYCASARRRISFAGPRGGLAADVGLCAIVSSTLLARGGFPGTFGQVKRCT